MGKNLRAGIIGHTGRGDYGHHLDVSYQWVPDVDVVAVADPDPEGLEAAGVKVAPTPADMGVTLQSLL